MIINVHYDWRIDDRNFFPSTFDISIWIAELMGTYAYHMCNNVQM